MSRASTSVSVLSGGTLRVTEIVSVDREPSVVVSPSARVSSAVFAVHASSFAWSTSGRHHTSITQLSHLLCSYSVPQIYTSLILTITKQLHFLPKQHLFSLHMAIITHKNTLNVLDTFIITLTMTKMYFHSQNVSTFQLEFLH